MQAVTLIILLSALIFLSVSAIYCYVSARQKVVDAGLEPFSPYLIGLSAAAFAVLIMLLFFAFVDEGFSIKGNMGQVGDFIGGLTNPVLSFIGLIVLLRTTLIQTNEARKTSLILLEQQKLFEQERFESSFYQLLERFEAAAEGHWRKATDDGSTFGLKTLRALRARREEFDELPLKARLKEITLHTRSNLDNDKDKKIIMRLWKVIEFIDDSRLPKKRKKYYFSILVDAMEPCELVVLLSMVFLSRAGRKRLRVYRPSNNIKNEFFVASLVGDYFLGN